MRQLSILIGRNITLFRSNKRNVLLSFFSILIVMGLYAVFLRDFILDSVIANGLAENLAEEFTDRMMVGGLMIVLNTTTCFGIMQLCVNDNASGIRKDFLVAPVTEFKIMIGYLFSSVLISAFFTMITVVSAECYFYLKYENPMELSSLGLVTLLVLISSIMNSLLLLCFMKGIKDTTTFSTFGNLYGMMVGFLAGTYLPYHMYPETLKKVLFFYPPTHLTSLMRQVYLHDFEQTMKAKHPGSLCQQLFEVFGVHTLWEANAITVKEQLCLLVIFACLFVILLQLSYRKSNRTT